MSGHTLDYGITLELQGEGRTHHTGQGTGYPAGFTCHKDEGDGGRLRHQSYNTGQVGAQVYQDPLRQQRLLCIKTRTNERLVLR